MKFIYFIIICFVINFQSAAQFSLDGELRPRTEFRHGYGTLISNDEEPGFGISTRARLKFGYQKDSYRFYLSIQDVLVWGENRQTLPKDLNNSFSIFQAWAKINFSQKFYTKFGRQILSYDDQRIMGGLDWAQQGRNHDAILFNYQKDKFLFDIGLAYNQDYDNISGFQSVGNTYYTQGFFSYKTMFYGYFKKRWEFFSTSLLLLNNGFQNFELDGVTANGISNLQTLGAHLKYKKGKFGAVSNLFIQSGERQNEVDIKGAFLVSLDLSLAVSDKVSLGIGGEAISGNDAELGSTGAFFPLYGTNHKFNGYMDYFYVGNHANSIGLIDTHASSSFNIGDKSNLLVKVLNFSGEQSLPSGDQYLGTELDLVFTKKFNGFLIKVGYSQMFAGDGMYELKGIDKNLAADIQNWAWLMLVLKPKFL